MSGIAGLISAASADDMLAASLALGKIDPVRELGLDLEIAQYNTRLEALTDPKAYAKSGKPPSSRWLGMFAKAMMMFIKAF